MTAALRLGVNIDHVATIRNARGGEHPDPVRAAEIVAAVGGGFDWYAGNRKEIHAFWWKIYMAWLIRTIDRPELLKRYPKIGLFFWHLMLARVGVKKHPEFDNGRG